MGLLRQPEEGAATIMLEIDRSVGAPNAARIGASRAVADARIRLRKPHVADAGDVWQLVRDSGILDVNSAYCYMLLASHFAETCLLAERRDRVVGFVTGYRPPDKEDTAFLWQIGVAKEVRGRKLGLQLARGFLALDGFEGVRFLETTVTPSNRKSDALFRALRRELGTRLEVRPHFEADLFPEDGHETERLYRIGPFDEAARTAV